MPPFIALLQVATKMKFTHTPNPPGPIQQFGGPIFYLSMQWATLSWLASTAKMILGERGPLHGPTFLCTQNESTGNETITTQNPEPKPNHHQHTNEKWHLMGEFKGVFWVWGSMPLRVGSMCFQAVKYMVTKWLEQKHFQANISLRKCILWGDVCSMGFLLGLQCP